MRAGKQWFMVKRGEGDVMTYLFSANSEYAVAAKCAVLFPNPKIVQAKWSDLCLLLGGRQPGDETPEDMAAGSILIPGSGVTDVCLWPL